MVQLPVLPAGRHPIEVSYLGTEVVEAATAPPIQLQMGRR